MPREHDASNRSHARQELRRQRGLYRHQPRARDFQSGHLWPPPPEADTIWKGSLRNRNSRDRAGEEWRTFQGSQPPRGCGSRFSRRRNTRAGVFFSRVGGSPTLFSLPGFRKDGPRRHRPHHGLRTTAATERPERWTCSQPPGKSKPEQTRRPSAKPENEARFANLRKRRPPLPEANQSAQKETIHPGCPPCPWPQTALCVQIHAQNISSEIPESDQGGSPRDIDSETTQAQASCRPPISQHHAHRENPRTRPLAQLPAAGPVQAMDSGQRADFPNAGKLGSFRPETISMVETAQLQRPMRQRGFFGSSNETLAR